MLIAAIVTLIIIVALGFAQRSGRQGETIVHRPYNNLYNDASAARDHSYR